MQKEHTTMKLIKEQLQMYGASTLSTMELLAYLLDNEARHEDALIQAGKLLDTYNLCQLQTVDWPEMMSNAGLSEAQAQRLNIVCELARRLASAEIDQRKPIKWVMDAAALLKPLMMHLDHEECRVLVLDIRSQVIANVLLYRGTINSSVLRASEVFRPAMIRNAPSLILAHNHPSTDPTPSPEDIEITQQLSAAGKLLDIELVDHIIIGNPHFVSLKRHLNW
jgi:DNA repair protein RadC